MRRAPKKYTDATRSQITPAWSQWYAEKKAARREDDIDLMVSLGQDPAMYYPEDYGKDLGEGSWIFVIDPPQAVALDFDVPLLSLWWARPHRLNAGSLGGQMAYQGVITTPAGDLHLWPHEYTICSHPEEFIGAEGNEIHSLGGQPVLDAEQLFYLQSRGISRHDATMLLFTEIRQQNFIYVTLAPEYVDYFAGVGTRIGSTAAQRWYASREAQIAAAS